MVLLARGGPIPGPRLRHGHPRPLGAASARALAGEPTLLRAVCAFLRPNPALRSTTTAGDSASPTFSPRKPVVGVAVVARRWQEEEEEE